MDVAAILNRIKRLTRTTQDQEIASYFDVPRTNVASWRRRNSIPAAYLFKIVDEYNVRYEWLVRGDGVQSGIIFNEKVASSISEDAIIDKDILWLALVLARNELRSAERKSISYFASTIDPEKLQWLHITLGEWVNALTIAKQKWERADLVKQSDVFRAIALEHGLSEEDGSLPKPWWHLDMERG